MPGGGPGGGGEGGGIVGLTVKSVKVTEARLTLPRSVGAQAPSSHSLR